MTRLTALELFGFKSFADRTRFEFPPGITVVVGPNGSGKSNVVDAIKWVLGEQSVRSLRGKEMTDVIFAGSAARKPLNMAEVSLCFDNAAGELPASTEEVRISRRVYRNGESEYLVNGEPARLRDIRELFSGTGAATEAYSVIEQGRVDALLVASGRDRRAVFEEAAGITKFRTRRGEALRRLERAEQNRQRLADIVGEVAGRLETVRHQAARARRWRTMQDRLRVFRVAAATHDLAGVDVSIATVEESLAVTRSTLEEQESLAAGAAEDVAALTTAAESLQPRLTAARSAAAADVQRAAAAEATASLTRQRREAIEADEGRAVMQLEAAVHAERVAATALATARNAADAVAAAVVDLESRLAACERTAAGSHDDATSARAAFDAAAATLDELERRLLRLEGEHDREKTRATEARAGADTAHEAVAAARRRHGLLGESRAACEGHLLSLEGRLTTADGDVQTLGVAQRDAAASLKKAWSDVAGWRAALEACRERRGMLHEIVARQEGVSDAARRLLAEGAAGGLPGFAGVLADLLVAPVEWAAVVDLALGDLGQSLVVDSIDEAVRWHAEWSTTNRSESVLAAGGRIGFLAAEQLREPEEFTPLPHPGIVGRLDRLLLDHATNGRTAEESTLVRRLFGRVWIVERIEHALPLLPGAPAGTLFLTRSGVSLTADGGFAIGTPAASSGLVARRSELRSLDERQAELERTVAAAQATVDRLQHEMAAREADIASAMARRQQASETIASSKAELIRVISDQRAAEESIDILEREARHADQRAAAADAAAESAREMLARLTSDVSTARAEAARCRGSIETVERSRGEAIDELHRLRIQQATAAEKLARCRDSVLACTATHEARRADVGVAMGRISEARSRLTAYDLDILAASGLHAETMWSAERSAAVLAALTAEADALEARRRAATAVIEAARTAMSRLSERTHALELEAGEARHQRSRIVERIRDEYDIDIDAEQPPSAETPDVDAEPIPGDRAELESRIEELRRKLASMTSVNMEALKESEELAERLATLEGQLADVTGAKESIEQLITRIDDESRRLLGETIETVRGHFRDLFERVFGGGQADIVLEPGVDLLETSVEILARPPGKEPRSISLLSGGEKTMTCVALLLAIFKSRPSPFCVLDEVDAALDEANVDRFVGVLRDFLSSTQFIVVTHSKKTMASATTLYGVTQEESGVSKRVSVRFESTAAAARPASRAA
jgi:chromosome segregation protein